MHYTLTSAMPTRIAPTPAHCQRASRSRRNTHASSTVTALKSDEMTETTAMSETVMPRL